MADGEHFPVERDPMVIVISVGESSVEFLRGAAINRNGK
jgi:hypothetical protein